MGGLISYDFGGISNASAGMGSTAGAVTGKLEELRAAMNQLKSVWVSQSASVSWSQIQDQFDRTSVDLNQMLQQFGQATGQAGDHMQAVEGQNARRF